MCAWRKEAVRPSQQPWQLRTHKENGGDQSNDLDENHVHTYLF